MEAAIERGAVGAWGGHDSGGGLGLVDEMIDRMPGIGGEGSRLDGEVGPVLARIGGRVGLRFLRRPGQAHRDPLGEGGDGFGGEFVAFLRHGRDALLAGMRNRTDEDALGGLLQVDDLAVVAAGEPAFAMIQFEPNLGLRAGVAIEAAFREERAHLLLEKFDLRGNKCHRGFRFRCLRLLLCPHQCQARQVNADEKEGAEVFVCAKANHPPTTCGSITTPAMSVIARPFP
jgi:hypothetical protein